MSKINTDDIKSERRNRKVALAKLWRDANPEKMKASRKRLYDPEYYSNWYLKNKERLNKKHKEYRETHRPLRAANEAARRSQQLQATPIWADLEEIKHFYFEAAQITKQTGIPHQVDHHVPLQSNLVCGLHCPANLRIIPSNENQKKRNTFDPLAFE